MRSEAELAWGRERPQLTMSDLDGLRGQRFATLNDASIPATRVLGVPVSLVSLAVAVRTIVSWCEAGTAHFVCVRDVHGIMRAQDDPALMALHEQAGLVTPDGMPLVWLARHRGHNGVDRVCGSDLVTALSRVSVDKGIRHYFYGGKPGVAERMAAALSERYPGLEVAGTYTPPFRALTVQEDSAVTAAIVAARPHIVWVGLSTPTQEYWMRDHVDRIPGATLIGVGAAFDFHTGDVKRAPVWMRSRGLEWLHRLVSEPRRLWRRYLVLAPRFVVAVAQEQRGR